MMLLPSLLLAGVLLGAEPSPPTLELTLGPATDKMVSPLHFGVNTVFFFPGIHAGMKDPSEPDSKHREFSAALAASGIRSLRLPGGDCAYFYLPESRKLTMELAHAIGQWEFNDTNPVTCHFIRLEDIARFSKEHKISLIYQLPVLFHLDGQTPRAAIRSVFSDKAKNYDHDRIEAQAAYAAGIAKRLIELGAPVAAWELGNEEWAHCGGQDYARVAAAVAERVRSFDTKTPIIPVGAGDKWFTECTEEWKRIGALDLFASLNSHYPFGSWPGPTDLKDNANLKVFAEGDFQPIRHFDADMKKRAQHHVPQKNIAITETMVFRLQWWDSHRVIGTHSHALLFAWNWMPFLTDPRCDVACFHDLESTYFGMLRYDVGYDDTISQFVWLAGAKPDAALRRFSKEYVLSPTAVACRLLSSLIGCRIHQSDLGSKSPHTRVVAGEDAAGNYVLVLAHRGCESVKLKLKDLTIKDAQTLTADNLGAALPEQYRVRPLAVDPQQSSQLELPARSVTLLRASKK